MNKNEKDFIVQKIRTQYIEKETSDLDELRNLDAKVKRPAIILAYVLGCVSAIVMGTGMSLIMTDIGSFIGLNEALIPGIVIGIVGMFMAIINYPIFKIILNSRKKKFAAQIIKLSDDLMKN